MLYKIHIRYQFILLLALCYFGAEAQIIKVDADWVQSDSVKAWQGVIDLSADHVRNTISIFQMAGSVQVSHNWQQSRTVLLSASNLRLLYESNQALENAGHQHFRYIRELDSAFSIEGFTQVQFDQLLKIRMRWVTGAGLRFALKSSPKAKLYLRPGYMYEYEQEDSTGIVNSDHRLSNYLSLRLRPNDKMRFYLAVFYQPKLGDFSDFRLSPAWTLEMIIIKGLTISISGDVRYDSNPVSGVDNTTYVLTHGLGWRF